MNGATNTVSYSKPARETDLSRWDGPRSVPVAEGYERWAPLYDQTPNPLLAREERYLLPLLPDLRNKSVLDLGCGTGRWLEHLMAGGIGSGLGIDISMAMLQVAGKKEATKGRLARASCENLPLSKAVFDLAICSFAIGHIPELGAMVRELARVTRVDGDVFVSDLHPEAHARGWRVGFREGGTAVQIETRYRPVGEIIQTFCSNGFNCEGNEALWLGAPEEPLFARAGKAHVFGEACRHPAVLVCHFRRAEDSQ
jgi:ubiquinone/menaquinone biosynthesis C-methylase UbiE